jgi:hypothetical protein
MLGPAPLPFLALCTPLQVAWHEMVASTLPSQPLSGFYDLEVALGLDWFIVVIDDEI